MVVVFGCLDIRGREEGGEKRLGCLSCGVVQWFRGERGGEGELGGGMVVPKDYVCFFCVDRYCGKQEETVEEDDGCVRK